MTSTNDSSYDLIIIGAGPAGISAAARANENNLNFLVLDKGAIANTLDYYYQYGKFVMSQPLTIPLRSDVPFDAGSREDVLEIWNDYLSKNEIKINTNEPVNQINKSNSHFEVQTSKGSYTSKNVVLSIGKLGSPRKVNCPGEELEFISDRLVDPKAYINKDILVVGGGDSAVEVALALSEQNRVSISYRKSEFFRMNSDLLRQVTEKIETKQIRAYFNSNVIKFEEGYSYLTFPDRDLKLKTDAVFVKIGAEVPRPFLKKCGIEFSSDEITALPVKDDKFETNIKGLYVIGAIGGKDLIKSAMNEGYEVIEHIAGNKVEPVDEPILQEKLISIPGNSVNEKLDYISSKVPLLRNIQPQLLREFFIQSEILQLGKDQKVYSEGDFSTTFFSIVEGVVRATFEENPEKEVYLRDGDFFGEVSLLADRKRSSTIITTDNCILIETPRRTMLTLINSEPSVKRVVDEIFTLNTLQSSLNINIFNYEFREIAPKLEVISFNKGDYICKEGEDADSIFIIRKGSVKISKKTKEGTDYVINYLPSGSYFGETSLIYENSKRGADVIAATTTEVIRIGSSEFKPILEKRPELELRIKNELEKRKIEASSILKMSSENEDQSSILSDFIKHGVVESTDVLIIDETKCIRCDNCVKACEGTHGGQTRIDRIPGPSFGKIHIPIACRHCEGAPCLQDCPPGDAIVRDSNGVVKIDDNKCIGCGNCAGFCPYGVIFMVDVTKKPTMFEGIWSEALSLTRGLKGDDKKVKKVHKGIAVKCDLCENISGGPACVRSCPTGAAVRVTPEYFKEVEFR